MKRFDRNCEDGFVYNSVRTACPRCTCYNYVFFKISSRQNVSIIRENKWNNKRLLLFCKRISVDYQRRRKSALPLKTEYFLISAKEFLIPSWIDSNVYFIDMWIDSSFFKTNFILGVVTYISYKLGSAFYIAG